MSNLTPFNQALSKLNRGELLMLISLKVNFIKV